MRLLTYAIGVSVIALMVVAAMVAVWFVLRRVRRRKEEGSQREPVERDSALADDARELFDALLRRFRRTPGARASAVPIRRLYGEMLARAEADGVARQPSATPAEFAPALDARSQSDAPTAITGAFVASRYGGRDADADSVARLRQAWEDAAGR
jgi:hypothetical protein